MNVSNAAARLLKDFYSNADIYNAEMKQIRVEGEPEKSFRSGIKTSGRAAYYVRALRCGNCNFLEFYTTDDADLSGGFGEIFGG